MRQHYTQKYKPKRYLSRTLLLHTFIFQEQGVEREREWRYIIFPGIMLAIRSKLKPSRNPGNKSVPKTFTFWCFFMFAW